MAHIKRKQYRRAEVSIDEDAQPTHALELKSDKYQNGSCTLEAFDLSYWVRGRSINSAPKQLLRGVSMRAEPGEVCAIMGPSGAGKTTLLDILASRKRSGLLHGIVSLNGFPVSKLVQHNQKYFRNIGYVLQGDLHLPQLTVHETVSFAASLRMDGDSSAEVIADRVESMLTIMRLKSIADMRVGGIDDDDGSDVTLTDGELKRLSLAVEMVSLPGLMFCDEPTTGLDAPTAYDVMKSIAFLADSVPNSGPDKEDNETETTKRTICVTVHQPSIEVFNLCSKVLLLGAGRVIYFGPTSEVVTYFTSSTLNYEFEEGSNPADFMVTIAGGGLVSEVDEQPTSPAILADLFQKSNMCKISEWPPINTTAGIDHLLIPPLSSFAPFSAQFKLLLKRAWLSIIRRHDILLTQLLKAVAMALVVGLVYHEVFKNPDAPWINIFDDACSLADQDRHTCLYDITQYSTFNVSCVYNEDNGKCSGGSSSLWGKPSLNDRLVFGPVCNLAPMIVETNYDGKDMTLHEACRYLNKYMGGRDGGCVLETYHSTINDDEGELVCQAGRNLGNRLSSASLNACSLFFIAILYTTMGNLQEIPRLFESRRMFKREVSSGAYAVVPLWASQLLVHLPVQVACFTVFFNLVYWLIGIPTGEHAANYFYCYILLLTTNAVGFAYAQFLAISAPTSDWALAVFPISFLFFSTFSGFCILVDDIPLGWRWGRYVSFVRWGFQGLVSQIFGSVKGGKGVIAFWGFENQSPISAVFILLLYCGILNFGGLFWMFESRSTLKIRMDPNDFKKRSDLKKKNLIKYEKPNLLEKAFCFRSDSSLDLEALDLDPASLTSVLLLDDDGLTIAEKATEKLARLHPYSRNSETSNHQSSSSSGGGGGGESGGDDFDICLEEGDVTKSPKRKHHVEVSDYGIARQEQRDGNSSSSYFTHQSKVGMRLMFHNIRLSVKPSGFTGHGHWLSKLKSQWSTASPYDHLVNETPTSSPTSSLPHLDEGREGESGGGAVAIAEKELLKGVSGRAQPGEILAIMGPSGAGKTSLIELLAGRKRKEECTAQGSVMINGHEVEANQMWRLSSDSPRVKKPILEASRQMEFAYVAQMNYHIGVLSVRETLNIAVALRLSLPSAPLQEGQVGRSDERSSASLSQLEKNRIRDERVGLLMDMLGLRSIANVLVSSSSGGGLSGGEAKRLSIAVELVNLPNLIFLDEPTSGLDAMTAHEVSTAIRALANQNRTIITTIHQPSVTTFALFDNLLLLVDGYSAYYGPLRKAVPHFVKAENLNIKYRRGLNPADFLVAAISSRDSHQLALTYQDSELYKVFHDNMSTTLALDLAASQAHTSPPPPPPPLNLDASNGKGQKNNCQQWFHQLYHGSGSHPSSFPEQVRSLVTRSSLHALREPRGLFGVVFRHLVVAVFFATLFRVNNHSSRNPQNIASLLFFSIFFIVVGHQHSMPVMISQRLLWCHERRLKLYSTRSLYVAQLIMKWPTHVMCILMYSIIVYTSCGLRPSFGCFIYFVFLLSLATLISLSLCEVIAALSPSAQTAIVFYLPVSFYFIAFGGYFVLIPSLPSAIKIFPASSYLRWTFQGLMVNQYEGNDDVLSTYGFDGFNKADVVLPLLFILVAFESLKFLTLRVSTA